MEWAGVQWRKEVKGMELKKKAEDLLEKQLQLLNQEDLPPVTVDNACKIIEAVSTMLLSISAAGNYAV